MKLNSPNLVRYPSPKAGRSPRITTKDLENSNDTKTEMRLKQVVGFILAFTTIGLIVLMFVLVTTSKN